MQLPSQLWADAPNERAATHVLAGEGAVVDGIALRATAAGGGCCTMQSSRWRAARQGRRTGPIHAVCELLNDAMHAAGVRSGSSREEREIHQSPGWDETPRVAKCSTAPL